MDAQIKVSLLNAALAILVPVVVTGLLAWVKGRLTPQQQARAEALTEALGGEGVITQVILSAASKPADKRREWAVAELEKIAKSEHIHNWSVAVANQVVEWFLERSKVVR